MEKRLPIEFITRLFCKPCTDLKLFLILPFNISILKHIHMSMV